MIFHAQDMSSGAHPRYYTSVAESCETQHGSYIANDDNEQEHVNASEMYNNDTQASQSDLLVHIGAWVVDAKQDKKD